MSQLSKRDYEDIMKRAEAYVDECIAGVVVSATEREKAVRKVYLYTLELVRALK